MKKILFVCHGNICRSPMAEMIFNHLAKASGLEKVFRAESAAVSAEDLGNPLYGPARRTLISHGVPVSEHRARQISPADYGRFDFIVGMDASNLRRMERTFGGDRDGKLSLLMDWTPRGGGDVADPWYSGDFEAAWLDISEGVRCLISALGSESSSK